MHKQINVIAAAGITDIAICVYLWLHSRTMSETEADPISNTIPQVTSPNSFTRRMPIDPELANYRNFGVTYIERERANDVSTPIVGFVFRGRNPTDEQLKQMGGSRLSKSLRWIRCFQPDLSDLGVLELLQFPSLEEMNVGYSRVTDHGCQIFGKIRNLQVLGVTGTAFADDALATLNGHPKLRVLDVSKTLVTDLGLRRLRSLPKLELLSLEHTNVGKLNDILDDCGLFRLRHFPLLKILRLAGTRPTDESLAALVHCKALTYLELTDVPITDENLEHWVACPSLEELVLDSQAITDRGAQSLARMKNLRRLTIANSSLTEAGLVELGKLRNMTLCMVRTRLLPIEYVAKRMLEMHPNAVTIRTE